MKNNYYQKIIKESPLGYAYLRVLLNIAGKPYDYAIIDVNAGFESLFGLELSEISGNNISDIIPSVSEYFQIFEKIALNGGYNDFDYYSMQNKKWLRINIFSPDKHNIVLLIVDISDEKQKIAELNVRLATLNDIVFELDQDHCFKNVWIDDEKKLFMPKEAFLNKNVEQVFSKDMADLFCGALLRSGSTEQKEYIEYGSPFPGDDRFFKAEIIPKRDINDKLIFLVAIADITRHHNAIRLSEFKDRILLTTLDSVSEAVIILSSDGYITHMNSLSESIAKVSKKESIGRPIGEVFEIKNAQTGKIIKDLPKNLMDTLKADKFGDDLILVSKDGSAKHIKGCLNPVYSDKDHIIGAVLVFPLE